MRTRVADWTPHLTAIYRSQRTLSIRPRGVRNAMRFIVQLYAVAVTETAATSAGVSRNARVYTSCGPTESAGGDGTVTPTPRWAVGRQAKRLRTYV